MDATPVIGFTCSTLSLPEMRGVERFALSRQYTACVLGAGGLPMLLPSIRPEAAAAYLARVDGLVLSGGLDVDPAFYGQEPRPDLGQVDHVRDEFELALVRGAKAEGIPMLCVCRGMQVLNVAFGGTLLQHLPAQVEGALCHDQSSVHGDAVSHTIDIVPETRLHALAGTTRTRTNSFHHQAVDVLAEGFLASARARDGVVEGMEDPDHPFCVAVQWHPERRPGDPLTQALFAGLVEAARQAARAGA